jgi:Arc/MetJ-type ribon-helix-helix transcriptional regulator
MGKDQTASLSERHRAFIDRKVAEGAYPSFDAAISAGIDALIENDMLAEGFWCEHGDEMRRRDADPPEMFEPFDADEMRAWLDRKAAARKAGTDAA